MIWRLHEGLGIPAESLIKVGRSRQPEAKGLQPAPLAWGRQVHRRERWRTRRSASEADKAKAVRTGGKILRNEPNLPYDGSLLPIQVTPIYEHRERGGARGRSCVGPLRTSCASQGLARRRSTVRNRPTGKPR
jgi:hypothetical protein